MSNRLEGQVAIVVGGGGGIGIGVARRLAREAATVVVVDLSEKGGADCVRQLEELGAKALFVRTDASDKSQIDRMMATVIERFGRVDILVNLAQVVTPYVPLEQKTKEMFDTSISTGLYSSVWAMQAAFPHMKRAGHGRIINTSSNWGRLGYPLSSDYNATKEAVNGITRSGANEWGQYGITVNAIMPSAESTNVKIFRELNPGVTEQLAALVALRRFGDPEEDIGGAILGLATDCGFVTGMVIGVDGGSHIRSIVPEPPKK